MSKSRGGGGRTHSRRVRSPVLVHLSFTPKQKNPSFLSDAGASWVLLLLQRLPIGLRPAIGTTIVLFLHARHPSRLNGGRVFDGGGEEGH